MTTSYTYTAPEDAAGRLDKWLAETAGLSRARLQALMVEGLIHCAGRVITSGSEKVKPGAIYSVTVPAVAEDAPIPQNIPLDVLYEDEHLIVVNKPAGLSMHPGAGQPDGTLVNALLHHCAGSLSGIGGVARPGIVHRLDQDTTGVVVCAKTDLAHQHLSAQFEARSTDRVYKALVRGAPPFIAHGLRPARARGTGPDGQSPLPHIDDVRVSENGWCRIENHIARSTHNRQKMAVVKSPKEDWAPIHGQGLREDKGVGRLAITNYRVLDVFGDDEKPAASLVQCKLETGRTHQIRVHMAHIGHPVLGDPVYGSGAPIRAVQDIIRAQNFIRQALHAASLGFTHPVTDKRMNFKAEMPDDMQDLMDALSSV
jgi:23S rRNA pseudouridine1911/1915/1917 synthase